MSVETGGGADEVLGKRTQETWSRVHLSFLSIAL